MSIYTSIQGVNEIEMGYINKIVREDGEVLFTRKISIQYAPDQRMELTLYSEDEDSFLISLLAER
jgi:hypothetical protein